MTAYDLVALITNEGKVNADLSELSEEDQVVVKKTDWDPARRFDSCVDFVTKLRYQGAAVPKPKVLDRPIDRLQWAFNAVLLLGLFGIAGALAWVPHVSR